MIRTELPWHLISAEVIRAINAYNNGRRFVDCGDTAEYIIANISGFPHFEDITYRAAQGRVMTALRKKGWTRYNRYGCGRPGVYIDPRVRDEITDIACLSSQLSL